MPELDPKLVKIVALAKQGIGGEKSTADRLVRAACERYGLDYAEVMAEDAIYKEYRLSVRFKNSMEKQIMVQVCSKFADSNNPNYGLKSTRSGGYMFITTTPGQFIEVSQAIAVYIGAFRKQRRQMLEDFTVAFVYKNDLYPERPTKDVDIEPPEQTLEQKQAAWRQAQLLQTIERTPLRKAIEAPKE